MGVWGAERVAAALPGQVTLYEVPRAGHVESWNVGPQSFDSRFEAFLRTVLAPG